MRDEAVEIINELLNKLTYHRIVVDYELLERIQDFIHYSKEKDYDFGKRI